jgi:hypothetical protein
MGAIPFKNYALIVSAASNVTGTRLVDPLPGKFGQGENLPVSFQLLS